MTRMTQTWNGCLCLEQKSDLRKKNKTFSAFYLRDFCNVRSSSRGANISSKSCTFQAILMEKPLFWANFVLKPPLGSKLHWAPPLTKILDPRLNVKELTVQIQVGHALSEHAFFFKLDFIRSIYIQNHMSIFAVLFCKVFLKLNSVHWLIRNFYTWFCLFGLSVTHLCWQRRQLHRSGSNQWPETEWLRTGKGQHKTRERNFFWEYNVFPLVFRHTGHAFLAKKKALPAMHAHAVSFILDATQCHADWMAHAHPWSRSEVRKDRERSR